MVSNPKKLLLAGALVLGAVCALWPFLYGRLAPLLFVLQGQRESNESLPSSPMWANKAFTPGASLKTKDEMVQFSEQNVGELSLPSGKVVASDVFFSSLGQLPLNKSVPSGKYPVSILIARYFSSGAQNIAFAKITFNKAPIVSWELATTDSDTGFGSKTVHSRYPVDSGTGCFTDLETAKEMSRLADTSSLNDRIIAALGASTPPGCNNADILISEGRNLICFSSGFGDGSYASYWGLDADGKVCALVTDFDLLSNDVSE